MAFLKRKTPIKAKTGFKRPTKPMKKVGKKSRENAKANRDGDKILAAHGITSCEIRRDCCLGSYALTRAHRKKRRFCDAEELRIFAYACVACHDEIEAMSHEAMFNIVDEAIKSRD